MLKDRLRLKRYRKILALVLLMTFWKIPIYAEPLTELLTNSSESGMRYYSDSEVQTLIDDLTEAALQSIEQAAGEAARAAFLQSLERESEAMREASRQQAENQRLRNEAEILKQTGIRNNFIVGVICFISGLVVGTTATILLIK